MKAPDRIRATWYASDDAEMPNSTSALTPASKFWNSDRDLVEYIRADLVQDPVTVHANMLRGTIAKPTVEQIIHLYGVDALTKALAHVIVREAAPDALHRSFPEAGDGRPMPPMGDDLMIAGLGEKDARFVAVQLAQNGWTLTPTPVDASQPADPAINDPAAIREAVAAICAEDDDFVGIGKSAYDKADRILAIIGAARK